MKAHTRGPEPLSARRWVWLCAVLSVFCFAMLLNWFPARRMGDLVTLAPTINHAGRRRFLLRICSHLSRELVLNDGFSRMTQAELHGALHWHLEELKRVSAAVRLGDEEMGIKVGADFRNAEHNTLMYQNVCPWRQDDSDCSLPGLPDLEVDGLYSLILHFYEAVEAVLAQYGVQLEEGQAAYKQYLDRHTQPTRFPPVVIHKERYKLLQEDPHLKLVLQSFEGDLFEGFELVVKAFDHETDWSLETVHVELRLLFALYIISVVVVFYGLLFRRTFKATLNEVNETRAFMFRVPCHALDKTEVEQMRLFFTTSAFRLSSVHTTGLHTLRSSLPCAAKTPDDLERSVGLEVKGEDGQ
mmetsp:Transcript_16537/g.39561  ORF Transcript_16537/g.39561 Transcript_16537/m.39561 type:complete len:356 (+) Transcript_16537:2-1069(+)